MDARTALPHVAGGTLCCLQESDDLLHLPVHCLHVWPSSDGLFAAIIKKTDVLTIDIQTKAILVIFDRDNLCVPHCPRSPPPQRQGQSEIIPVGTKKAPVLHNRGIINGPPPNVQLQNKQERSILMCGYAIQYCDIIAAKTFWVDIFRYVIE